MPTTSKQIIGFSSLLLAVHVIAGILLILAAIYLVVMTVRARARVAGAEASRRDAGADMRGHLGYGARRAPGCPTQAAGRSVPLPRKPPALGS
jgi:hypothetical protein